MKMKIEWLVEREGDTLISTVKKIYKDKNQTAILRVGVKDFKIIDACFFAEKNNEIHDKHHYDMLTGADGYIQGKKQIKNLLKDEENNVAIELFLQGISALVQAETYVYKERGYDTKEEYNVYWDFLEKNGCRYYSEEMAFMRCDELKWMDYVEDRFQEHILFQRQKTYEIIDNPKENGYKIVAVLKDTYHEISIDLMCDENYIVVDGDISFVRAPGKACFTNRENVKFFRNKSLGDMTKSEIIENFGGRCGCYHVVEMILEIKSVT